MTDSPIFDTGSSGIVRSWIQGPAGLVQERAGSTSSYPLADAHGDITTIVDGSGAVSSRQTYDPWGEQLTGPSGQMRYLGAYQRRTDVDTSLVQMGIRPYDPGLGRFASEDPVTGARGLGQSLGRYSYVFNNALNLYDLTGRFPEIGVDLPGPLPSVTFDPLPSVDFDPVPDLPSEPPSVSDIANNAPPPIGPGPQVDLPEPLPDIPPSPATTVRWACELIPDDFCKEEGAQFAAGCALTAGGGAGQNAVKIPDQRVQWLALGGLCVIGGTAAAVGS